MSKKLIAILLSLLFCLPLLPNQVEALSIITIDVFSSDNTDEQNVTYPVTDQAEEPEEEPKYPNDICGRSAKPEHQDDGF